MVIGFGADRERLEPGRFGFVVAQPGAGGGLVEDLHDLGAQAPGEPPVPAERVLPGDPARRAEFTARLVPSSRNRRRL